MAKPGTNSPRLFYAFLCPCSSCFSPCMALGVSLYTQHIQGLYDLLFRLFLDLFSILYIVQNICSTLYLVFTLPSHTGGG